MSEEEIRDLIKKEILENMSVMVQISTEPYTDGEVFNVRVEVQYDGEEINSYGDTIRVPQ